MNKAFLHIAVLVFVLVGCATEKVAVSERTEISKKDYPYIEKFHEGIRLKTKGRVDEAILKFEECLLIRQDDDAVFYALSQLELMKGNLEKSSQHILQAAEIDPGNTWYIQELAYMYYEQKNFEGSIENFKKLVEIEPRNVDWQYGYAGALQEAGQNEEAIDALNKTEDQVGINPELSIQKYNLYMKIKDAEKGIAEIERARETFPKDLQLLATLVDYYYQAGQEEKAISLLEELVEADPQNGRAHLALADVYRQKGDQDKSYRELKLAFLGEGVDLDTKMKILMSIQESSFKIDPEVYELVDILVDTYPTEAKAHSVKGDYMLRAEKQDEALESYKKALEFEKNKYPIWNQVLIMEYQDSKFEDLYEHSKECLTLFPTISTVYLLQGVSANQLHKYDEALDALSVGRELVINDKTLEAEFFGQIGEAQFGLNEIEEGKAAYKKALELDGQSSLLRSNYAYRLAMVKKDLELAESLAKQALDAAPNQSQFKDTYGWVLFQKGDYTKALSEFTEAYEMNDQDNMIVEHLGDAHFMKGDKNEALKWWKKAKELSSKNKVLEKKIQEGKYYDPIY
jgi:tetratricopeptide (TPR) repeat protein